MLNNPTVYSVVAIIILVSTYFFCLFFTIYFLYLFWTMPSDKRRELKEGELNESLRQPQKTKSMKIKLLILNVMGYSLTGIYFVLFLFLIFKAIYGS